MSWIILSKESRTVGSTYEVRSKNGDLGGGDDEFNAIEDIF